MKPLEQIRDEMAEEYFRGLKVMRHFMTHKTSFKAGMKAEAKLHEDELAKQKEFRLAMQKVMDEQEEKIEKLASALRKYAKATMPFPNQFDDNDLYEYPENTDRPYYRGGQFARQTLKDLGLEE